jgi:protein-L-isoaspartate(D-aspartate) O-methyltransferase
LPIREVVGIWRIPERIPGVNAAVPVRRKVLIGYLREVGITDERVLAAIAAVPRELFVPAASRHQAYEDYALEIGEGQTISQPSVVARITELAEVGDRDRVLEIGAGSGYQAAVLARLARFVFTVECLPRLAEAARARLAELGCRNVSVQVMDGSLGWRAQAPFDVIVVSAAAPSIPRALTEQLTDGGRLIIPIGGLRRQRLVRVVKRGDRLDESSHGPATFVPLIGRDAFRGQR